MATPVELPNPYYTPAAIIAAIKDSGLKLSSDIYSVDRNIGNTINAGVAETKDVINRNSDFALNDNRRNVDFMLGDSRRASDLILSDAHRTGDMSLTDGRRNTDFVLNDSRRAQEVLGGAIERTGTASVLATQTAATNLGNAIERTGGSSVLATQTAATNLGNAVERTGSAAVLASQTAGLQVGNAVERIGGASVLATQSAEAVLGAAIERNGSQLFNETLRNGASTREAVNQAAIETRTMLEAIHSDSLKSHMATQLAAKDTEFKIAGFSQQLSLQTATLGNDMFKQHQMMGMDMLKMKSDLERQGYEQSALAARDSAAIAKEILATKADLAKQAAENTAQIQIEALKNKDQLSFQMSEIYRGLKSTALEVDSARLRDLSNDSRMENSFLKYGGGYPYGHHGHHDHYDHHRGRGETYIHNHLGYEREYRRDRSPERRGRSPSRGRGGDGEGRGGDGR